jgi:hypothetical protein
MKKNRLIRWLASAAWTIGFICGWPVASPAQTTPVRIDVVTVEGEGVTSNTHEHVAHDPVVRVEDEDHRPVAGAVVVFAVPISGTSGEFLDGAKSLTVTTDNDGLAAARGLRTNDIPGKLQILVTASFHNLRARGLVNQLVVAAPGSKPPASTARASKSSGKWKWVLLGVAAAGGAAAAIYLTHSSSSSSTTPVSVTAGAVTFGSPQ